MRSVARIAVLLLLTVTPVRAADPALEAQVAALAQRVTTLTAELNALKSVLGRATDGAVTLTAPRALRTSVGADATAQVARTVTLAAGDQLTLRAGSAVLVMKKDGTIQITGTSIHVSGSGPVTIKGAKLLTN